MKSSLSIYIPSNGNEWLTELAVLSAARYSTIPLSFVIGGCTGEEPLRLRRLKRLADVQIELALGRSHADWLDHWVRESSARFALFLDSDVFFLRRGWSSPIVCELEKGAALVTCEISERIAGVIEPVRGAVTTAMPRPAPWLMAIDVARIRETGVSFGYANFETDGELMAWDVGGKVLESLATHQFTVHSLPRSYSRYFRHIGGMSWRESPRASEEPRRWLRLQHARMRFARERVPKLGIPRTTQVSGSEKSEP